MSSLFSEKMISGIKSMRKTFLWTAVCILIGEVIVGAVLIIAQSFNLMIGKLMGTFALCAIVLFVGVNNFSLMEKGKKIVQGFALVSLIANITWLVLCILFIWEVLPFIEGSYFNYSMTVMARFMLVAIDVAVMCFWISNVWAIEETVKPVKPLKITAIICELYCGCYAMVITLMDTEHLVEMDSRWYALAGLAGFAFFVMAIAALIVSKSGKKKNEEKVSLSMDNTEMQAKIQEMVEKEVQARLASQGGEDAQASVAQEPQTTPELQVAPEPQPVQQTQVNESPQVQNEPSTPNPINPGTGAGTNPEDNNLAQ